MLDRVECTVTREIPSLDHYRREWTPANGVELAGIWHGAIVSDKSGHDYWGLRGCDDFIVGTTHVVSPVCGFRALTKSLDTDAPHLFTEYSGIDWFEPFQYLDDGSKTQMIYSSGRIERDADGMHWYDASGRWEMHCTTVSDVVVTHVPRQHGVEHDVYYRHELLYATGVIRGIEVSGYAHQDFAYGPPGLAYPELPIARHLQGMWVSWLHEYDDGQLGGGSFWQGRDGMDFGPGYQIKAGNTLTCNDVRATPTFNDAGKMTSLETAIGDDSYVFTFESTGSPIHFFGPVTQDSSGRQVSRSWCWVEYAGGMITPEILDMSMLPFRLARAR
jgi:hypothetical protein